MKRNKYIQLLITGGMMPFIPCLMSVWTKTDNPLYWILPVQLIGYYFGGRWLQKKVENQIKKQDVMFSLLLIAVLGPACTYFFMPESVAGNALILACWYSLSQIFYNFIFLWRDYRHWFGMPLLFLLAFACTGCTPSASEPQAQYNLNIDSASVTFPEVTETEYIPLETADASLIGHIDKIIYQNGTFYIFDKMGKRVLLFDRKGKFMKEIHQIGQGPGEYMEPNDMDVDKDGDIYISDWNTQSIIRYKGGNEKEFETVKIGEYFLDFATTDKGFYLGNVMREGKFQIDLAYWDREKQSLKTLQKNESETDRIAYAANHYFFRSSQTLCHYSRFQPNIDRLSADSVTTFIQMHSSHLPTPEELKAWNRSSSAEQFNYAMKYVGDLSACYENERHIFIVLQSMPSRHVVIDKANGCSWNIPAYKNKSIPATGVVAMADSSFVSYLIPTEENLASLLTYMTDPAQRQQLETLTPESNPVIFLFRMSNP